MATRGAQAGKVATVATATQPRRQRTARRATTDGTDGDGQHADAMRQANRRIQAMVDPPGECPWCMSDLGLPDTAGTTTRLCAWHEFTTWIQIATRYPQLWPKVRAQFGDVVRVRLVGRDEAVAANIATGALVVDIAVR